MSEYMIPRIVLGSRHMLVVHVNRFMLVGEEKLLHALSNTHALEICDRPTHHEQDDQVEILCTYSMIHKGNINNNNYSECSHQI